MTFNCNTRSRKTVSAKAKDVHTGIICESHKLTHHILKSSGTYMYCRSNPNVCTTAILDTRDKKLQI